MSGFEAVERSDRDSTTPVARDAVPSVALSIRDPQSVLLLQRQVGNSAVNRLLRQVPPASPPAPPAGVPNHINGEIGELLLSQALDANGLIVLQNWSKQVTENGIDLVVFDARTKEIWLIDNKAQWRGIADAPALTGTQYEGNVRRVQTWLESNSASKEATAALEALRAGRIRRVVANGFAGEATRFTRGLFDRQLCAYDIRLGRMFASYEAWATEFRALTGLARATRLARFRGSALFEGTMFVLFVAGGTAYLAHSGNARQIAGGLAADLALTTIISRLPGGLFASLLLGLESDDPYLMKSRRIDALAEHVPNYDKYTDEERKRAREILGQLIDEPMNIDPPPPPPDPIPFIKKKDFPEIFGPTPDWTSRDTNPDGVDVA
jgi:hypothetical protein